MMRENAIAGPKVVDLRTHLFDYTHRLMTQHEGRFALDIPGHDVARADTAGTRPHQNIGGPDCGTRAFLNADIAEIIEPGNLHLHRLKLCLPHCVKSTRMFQERRCPRSRTNVKLA